MAVSLSESIAWRMAWRNVWRNPRRSALTICAICFAAALLVFMLSFQFGSYQAMITNAVAVHSGHLQVQAEGYRENRDMRKVIEDPERVSEVLDATPGVVHYALRANGFAMLSAGNRTYGGLVIGIQPEAEARIATIEDIIRDGSYLEEGDTNQALVGAVLARNLDLAPGEEVVVLGQGRDGSMAATVYQVKGIYGTGQDVFDRSAIMAPLEDFQQVFSMRGAVHEAVAVVDDLGAVGEVAAAVSTKLDSTEDADAGELVVLDWRELLPGLEQSIRMDLFSGMILYVILIVVVAFSILNTFLMAVFERTREFGVMLAIGAGPGRIGVLLLLESAMLTAVGILAGAGLGVAVTLWFGAHGIPLGGDTAQFLSQYGIPDRIYPRLTPVSATVGPALVFLVTVVTALYPAFKVRRLEPVEAMHGV